LKSSSANIGADVLADICRQAEERARSGEILAEDVAGIARELDVALSLVRAELDAQAQAA
jgi:HPt (histidine-containing phosphotransfer) domain-containing protein